jgi:hypothetical protein
MRIVTALPRLSLYVKICFHFDNHKAIDYSSTELNIVRIILIKIRGSINQLHMR